MIIAHSLPGALWSDDIRPQGMLITDLDGTLKRTDGGFSPADLDALTKLGRAGMVRTIATGRSIYSFRKDVKQALPIDYLVFSTGVGIIKTDEWTIVRKISLEPEEVGRAIDLLVQSGLSFMVHRPVPDNHVFAYHVGRISTPDFERRMLLYDGFHEPLGQRRDDFGSASQLLAVVPGEPGLALLEEIRRDLEGFTVIRTTSPLDRTAMWIEIFPANVSKGLASAWLAGELGLTREDVAFVGDDFNDLDLLEWAGSSYVVANSPPELKARFPEVASNNHGGVAEAAERWLADRDSA